MSVKIYLGFLTPEEIDKLLQQFEELGLHKHHITLEYDSFDWHDEHGNPTAPAVVFIPTIAPNTIDVRDVVALVRALMRANPPKQPFP